MKRFPAFAGVMASFSSAAFAEEAEKKGMPQLDPSSYPSQIFWLAVFFLAFYLFMRGVAMPRLHSIIAARQARISDDLNHATTASGDAAALKDELDRSLNAAREQARGVLAAANDDIRALAAARDATLSAELAAKIEKAEAAIQVARGQALGSIEEIASGILVTALPKVASVSASDADIRSAVAKVAGGKA
jgi:F-type H+-transporting ATPase subunit b